MEVQLVLALAVGVFFRGDGVSRLHEPQGCRKVERLQGHGEAEEEGIVATDDFGGFVLVVGVLLFGEV